MVALAATEGRLLVQGLTRKFERDGDPLAITPDRLASASAEGAGGGWADLGAAVMDKAAVTLKLRTTDGEKVKLTMMRGTGPLGKLGGGESQRRRRGRGAVLRGCGALAADGPVLGAVALLQLDRDDRLGLPHVADRIAAGALRRVPPGGPEELEGAAVLAAAPDCVRVAAGLAFARPARPALVAGR